MVHRDELCGIQIGFDVDEPRGAGNWLVLYGTAGASKIIFDFGAVNYISSAGLREILICRKKFPDMRIENVRASVYKIFMMTGFDRLIAVNPIADDTLKFDNVLNEFIGAK